MNWQGYAQILLYLGAARGDREAAGRLHGARLRGTAASAREGSSAGSSASSIALVRGASRRGQARDAVDDLRARDARLQRHRRHRRLRARSACRTTCRSTRRGCRRRSPDLSWNTAVSFVTNTNWQNYGGETTLSYLTQMLALAVQNFVCAASGMAILVALIRGIARKQATGRSATSGSTSRAATLYILLPLSLVFAVFLVSPGRRADLQRIPFGVAAPGDQGRGRQERRRSAHRGGPRRIADRDQGARHERRRLLQRELGAPVREPDAALATSSSILSLLADPRGAHLHVREDGQGHAPGLGPARGDVRRVPAAALAVRRARAGGQPGARVAARSTRSPSALQAGGNMEGKEVRFGISSSAPLRHGDDGRVVRRGQRDARLLHAARRASCRSGSSSSARSSSAASAPACTACSCSPSSRCSSRGSWSGARPSTSARRSRPTR